MKINMHTSHLSAFISSTFIDLREDRLAVAQTLKNRGLNVNALDVKPASTQSSKNEILGGIKESDFVIIIIGDRYGSVIKNMTNNEYKSITWWEYDNAIIFGKPIIAYFKYFDINDPLSHDQNEDPLYKRKRILFERFKKLITQRHNPAYYSSTIEIADKIDKSLIIIYRSGVKKLIDENVVLKNRIMTLEDELKQRDTSLSRNSIVDKNASSISELLESINKPNDSTKSLLNLKNILSKK